MKEIVFPSLVQVVAHAPVLLVCLAGMILALVCWRLCPLPSLLVLTACGLILVVSVVQPFVANYLIRARAELGWSGARMGQLLGALGIGTSLVFAAGLGMLVAAAFLPRKPGSRPATPPG